MRHIPQDCGQQVLWTRDYDRHSDQYSEHGDRVPRAGQSTQVHFPLSYIDSELNLHTFVGCCPIQVAANLRSLDTSVQRKHTVESRIMRPNERQWEGVSLTQILSECASLCAIV